MHARILKPETHWPVREGNGNFGYFEVETKNKQRMGDHYQLSNNKLQSITPIFLTSYSVNMYKYLVTFAHCITHLGRAQ